MFATVCRYQHPKAKDHLNSPACLALTPDLSLAVLLLGPFPIGQASTPSAVMTAASIRTLRMNAPSVIPKFRACSLIRFRSYGVILRVNELVIFALQIGLDIVVDKRVDRRKKSRTYG